MKSFVARRNVERYRALLEAATDDATRRVLATLLAEEEAKLAGLIESSGNAGTGDAQSCHEQHQQPAPGPIRQQRSPSS